MAKEVKNVRVKIKEDAAQVDYCVCDGDLSKKVRKNVQFSAEQQADADSLLASIKADCESDEGI